MGFLDAFEADLRTPFGIVSKGSAGSLSTTSTWNPADQTGHSIVNIYSIRRDNTAFDSTRCGRGTRSQGLGRWYLEYTVISGGVGGFGNVSASLTAAVGSDMNSIGVQTSPSAGGGQIYYNNIGFGGAVVSNAFDVIGLCYDGSSGLVYVSCNGAWQNSGNPSAGSGGLTAPTGPLFPMFSSHALGDAITMNTGASPFSYGPPPGYNAWG